MTAELNRFYFLVRFLISNFTFEVLLQAGTQFECVGEVFVFVFLFFFDGVLWIVLMIAVAVRVGIAFELNHKKLSYSILISAHTKSGQFRSNLLSFSFFTLVDVDSIFRSPAVSWSLLMAFLASSRLFFWIFFTLARWFWNQTCNGRSEHHFPESILLRIGRFPTNLNDTQTESSLFGQIFSHFATGFRRNIKRRLECTTLLCVQNGARTLWTSSTVDFRWKYVFSIVIVCANKEKSEMLNFGVLAAPFTYH